MAFNVSIFALAIALANSEVKKNDVKSAVDDIDILEIKYDQAWSQDTVDNIAGIDNVTKVIPLYGIKVNHSFVDGHNGARFLGLDTNPTLKYISDVTAFANTMAVDESEWFRDRMPKGIECNWLANKNQIIIDRQRVDELFDQGSNTIGEVIYVFSNLINEVNINGIPMEIVGINTHKHNNDNVYWEFMRELHQDVPENDIWYDDYRDTVSIYLDNPRLYQQVVDAIRTIDKTLNTI